MSEEQMDLREELKGLAEPEVYVDADKRTILFTKGISERTLYTILRKKWRAYANLTAYTYPYNINKLNKETNLLLSVTGELVGFELGSEEHNLILEINRQPTWHWRELT